MIVSEVTKTHYDVLGLTPDAPEDVIKAVYKTRVRSLHPDRGGDPTEMAAINEAYAVLSDPGKRAVYDRDLRTAGGTRPTANAETSSDADDALDDEYWTEAEWWEEEPEPAATPDSGASTYPSESNGTESGLAILLRFIGLAGLWTLTLIVTGAVVIGGLIDDQGWKSIGLNLLVVALLTGVNLVVAGIRMTQPGLPKLYLAYVAILLFFGLTQVSSDPLTGGAVLAWCGLLALGAEASRHLERESWEA